MVSTLCGSKPGATWCNAANVRISSPAPASSTMARAISLTTSRLRVLFCRVPEPPRAPVSFSVALRSAREAWIAGTSPNTMPVRKESSSVNPSTVQSSVTPEPWIPILGMLPGFKASRARTPEAPMARPSTPPANESSTLSVRSWRTIRPRPAPIAARIAISRDRTPARASSRLATFAQAMSSTAVTAPSRIRSAGRTLRTMIRCIGSTVKLPLGASMPGNLRLYSSAARVMPAFAACSETPGLSRAATLK